MSPFEVIKENDLPYYVTKRPLPDNNELWVLLSYGYQVKTKSRGTNEMMICNFDPRRVFPYLEIRDIYSKKNNGFAVLPFKLFIDFLFDGQYHADYNIMLQKALEWREKYIKENYASGVIV